MALLFYSLQLLIFGKVPEIAHGLVGVMADDA
jgi:hypothetical protein